MKPEIVVPDYGKHNLDLGQSAHRMAESASWKKLDTIMIIPAGGTVSTKAALSWMNMYAPPNNNFCRIPTIGAIGMEVGEAFSQTIEWILKDPNLSKYKYILTMEHDAIVPPDALVKLLKRAEENPDFDVIGALYWTKGPEGVSQCWGDPRDPVNNYRPQPPIPGQLIEVCGTGMGTTLFRLDMFKDPDLRRPWFKTQTEGGVSTQDLYFASDARKHGYRFGVDCAVMCGHHDLEGKFGPPDMVW